MPQPHSAALSKQPAAVRWLVPRRKASPRAGTAGAARRDSTVQRGVAEGRAPPRPATRSWQCWSAFLDHRASPHALTLGGPKQHPRLLHAVENDTLILWLYSPVSPL